jgi:hypothetical protein
MPDGTFQSQIEFPFLIERPPFYLLPICHYRLEFAEAVRFAYHQLKPDAILLELPQSLTESLHTAVSRLPELSVILYQQNDESPPHYLLVEPSDPLVEAARLAVEHELKFRLIDLDLAEYPLSVEALPDSYAVMRIGQREYYEAYRQSRANLPISPIDVQREQAMALRANRFAGISGCRKILLVCGMAHVEGIAARLGESSTAIVESFSRPRIQIFNLHPDSAREVLSHCGFLSAIYEHVRIILPQDVTLGSYTVRKQLDALSLDKLIDYLLPAPTEEEALSAAIQWASRRVFSPCGVPKPARRSRIDRRKPAWMIDRLKVSRLLLRLASIHYSQDTGDKVERWQIRNFIRFSTRYALIQGMLIPDFFHLLTAARACVDDNFGYAFWRLGTHYPWQKEYSDQPTIKLSGEELHLGMRKISLRRFVSLKRRRWNLMPLKKRQREQIPGEWLNAWDGDMICSYPPEDIEIEGWSGFLKQKARRVMSVEKKKVEPFSTSLLDGIDVRETIRNFHEQKIYVQEFGKVGGNFGSVVVIFDDPANEDRYPFCMTWLGESYQEGDMAFYSTDPLNNVVGPGISRCEYGGFLISYPPLRLMDVWHDPAFDFTLNGSERLLAAAIDYSLEKYILYLATKPPRDFYRALAGRMAKQIVFLPLSTMSPQKVKKLRIFHILSGHDKRTVAPEYIW